MKTPNEEGVELAELVLATIDSYQDVAHRRIVFNRVLEALQNTELYVPPRYVAARPAISPMNHNEAAAFGRQTMPWGKYKGTPIEDVPREYLEFLMEPKPFDVDLKRYFAYLDTTPHQEEEEETPRYADEDIPF